jgi:DNA-binding transcriptional LysR family regulator
MSRRATTLVAKDLAEGRLVRPFGDDTEHDFADYIVHRPDVAKEPGVVAFKEWLLAEARLDAEPPRDGAANHWRADALRTAAARRA